MKSHTLVRGKGGVRVNPQQVIFELKHRVVLALNKLADRDTYQIGVDELERIAESLMPEGVVPFLSCVIDTDSEQKSAVRKECVRIMGTLARLHGALLGPHLGKIIGSIVKRLKDPDSVVRDACVETVGVLASKLNGCADESGGSFVVLVKPLFEALGEQNKQVQSGSALCLAAVIDNANNPPDALLMRMLTRVIKLLKNQHFMAKPALIELVRSIVQARGASTDQALSAAVNGIQDALKSTDWATRKAASVALAGMAASGGSFLSSFKASCILSLESCRFDKVKPVRDSVMQAIQYWKSLPGSDYPEPSEAGSSTKENFCGGDYADLASVSDGGWKDNHSVRVAPRPTLSGVSTSSTKKRSPLAVKKTYLNYAQSPRPKTNDWHIEIALPKPHSVSLVDAHNEESEQSCVTKTFERNANATKVQGIGYDYVPMDDKQESSLMSDVVSSGFETKQVTVVHSCVRGEDNQMKAKGMDRRSPAEENDTEVHMCSSTIERKSLDSTVTELSSQSVNECCMHTANELAFIRKKLLEIECKQSNLLDLIQVFMGNSMDGLSMLQSKVLGLEDAVDKIVQDLTNSKNYCNVVSSKCLKNNPSVSSSPRLSTSTPRPSVDTAYKQSLGPLKNREHWSETVFAKSRSSTSARQGAAMWRDPTLNIIKNPIAKKAEKSVGCIAQSPGSCQSRKDVDLFSTLACTSSARQIVSENNNLWKRVKHFVCMGDLEAAFTEALCSGDDLVLIELMDRTGPVLERLPHETMSEILSTIATHLLDQRFLDCIIPWLRQVVELSVTHAPNYLVPSAKVRKEFLCAIQEAASMNFPDSACRRCVTQLAVKLHQVWGK